MIELLTPRIGIFSLAELSRRLSISLASGLDIRRVWKREAETARGAFKTRAETIRDAVAKGVSLSEAFAECGDYFPKLFRELSAVGEQTGNQAEVFKQLSDHYDHQVKLRRSFFAALTWPLFQLFSSIFVIGLLIWIMGTLLPKGTDLLGFGLAGNSGLMIYCLIVGGFFAAVFALVTFVRRGALWIRPAQLFIMRVPTLGGALRTLALSNLSWSLYLTLESGMNLEKALRLSIASTHTWLFERHSEAIWQSIRRGDELHVAFRDAGDFPIDFVDAVQVGEESGRLTETLERLSKRYREQAQMAMAILTQIAGYMIWAAIAAFIIFMIFRLFNFYLNAIKGAL